MISELTLLIQSSQYLVEVQEPEVAKLIETYQDDSAATNYEPLECSINIHLSNFIIHIRLGKSYPETLPTVSVGGIHERLQHEYINKEIHNFLADCPIGEPLLDILIDFIQGILPTSHEADNPRVDLRDRENCHLQTNLSAPNQSTSGSYRKILFWAHHLLATSKRKQLRAQASIQDINVVSRVGYPGYIAAEGRSEDIQLFIQEVKAWRWAAIQLKYDSVEMSAPDSGKNSWRQRACLKSSFMETESLSEFTSMISQIPEWKNSMLH